MRLRFILFVLLASWVNADAVLNYCHDPETNAQWEDIKIRYVHDSDVIGLYKLRKSLCEQVDRNEITIEEATYTFEYERSRLIHKMNQRPE